MVGLGEIGSPILEVISKKFLVVGFDLNPKLMNVEKWNKLTNVKTELIHFCIPYSSSFIDTILKFSKEHNAGAIVIHSTIPPYTTERIQRKTTIPVIYSATRGIHKRMRKDLKRYVKFFSISDRIANKQWAKTTFEKRMKKAGVRTKQMSSPLTLELAKIVVDTSYYGWLINYAQLSNMIAIQHKVNYDEMWSFSDEIHKFLGNRPKMFPGFIGGHCVIPNLDLIHNQTLDLIKEINDMYVKKVKNAKTIAKKYAK
ncbi:MAG TPA: hypothetical protein VG896_01585 [Candidatus Nitrosotalea sp.]|nr:hypothetical protein [Candidatus Nitrosotalea sp.]